jgi:hypothetical protein
VTRDLRAALVVEGISDSWFLPTVLTRALRDIFPPAVGIDIQEVTLLPVRCAGGLVEGICAAAAEKRDSLTMVFYHYDGTADTLRARRQYWDPLVDAWRLIPGGRELVPVVPVREMEAWALADAAALCDIVGSGWSRRDAFQADRLPDVEKLEDPKRTLREITARGRGTRQRRREPREYLTQIAERVSLEQLRAVPSFRQWSVDTVEALRKLRFLP